MKAIVVALNHHSDDELWQVSLDELNSLCEACRLEVTKLITQNGEPTKPYFIGKGKVEEVKRALNEESVVVFNEELTPLQMRNLSNALNIEVIDRTDLILHIFNERAKTNEARLQVAIAKLSYELPRLAGMNQAIYSQQGGSGFRGAGEKEIELNRRRIRNQITKAKRQLEQLKKVRQTQRKKRHNEQVVALVGYTNAGKSSLLNYFTEKKVFEEDMLFATLETSTRQVMLKNHKRILMSDTVGFISDLPHHLVEAFQATLEEVAEADLIIQVIDGSSPQAQRQMEVTLDVIKRLGASHVPMIYAYNKIDQGVPEWTIPEEPHVFISVKEGTGMDELEDMIISMLSDEEHVNLMIPYAKGDVYQTLIRLGTIRGELFHDDAIELSLDISPRYRQYYADLIRRDDYD